MGSVCTCMESKNEENPKENNNFFDDKTEQTVMSIQTNLINKPYTNVVDALDNLSINKYSPSKKALYSTLSVTESRGTTISEITTDNIIRIYIDYFEISNICAMDYGINFDPVLVLSYGNDKTYIRKIDESAERLYYINKKSQMVYYFKAVFLFIV